MFAHGTTTLLDVNALNAGSAVITKTRARTKAIKVINKDSERKPNFFASCAAAISDAVIIGVLSFILLYVIDFILRKIVGVYIVDKNQMLFILYVVVSLLYVTILESTLGFTVGKTVFGIKVARN